MNKRYLGRYTNVLLTKQQKLTTGKSLADLITVGGDRNQQVFEGGKRAKAAVVGTTFFHMGSVESCAQMKLTRKCG